MGGSGVVVPRLVLTHKRALRSSAHSALLAPISRLPTGCEAERCDVVVLAGVNEMEQI
jgi:hypothetical protein